MSSDNSSFDPPPVLDLVVQLGVIRMPMFVGETKQDAFRPRMCMWVDAKSGFVFQFKIGEGPPTKPLELVAQSLEDLINTIHGWPRQIQMRDPGLAATLKRLLEPHGVEVVVRESLPMLDEALKSFGEFKGMGVKKEPSVINSPGMTLDRMIGFAEAAKQFYDARPWEHLENEDLIEVESPAGPKGTRFTQVLGAGGQEYGLGFVAKREVHEQMHAADHPVIPRGGLWSLLFGEIDFLPFDDGETWEQQNLPLAHAGAYPRFAKFMASNPRGKLPTAEELAWVEGLLRALATTSEDELDNGRWEKQVETAAGPRVYKLSMPILLEQIAGEAKPNPVAQLQSGRMLMEQMLRGIGQKLAELPGERTKADLDRIINEVNSGGMDTSFQPRTPAEQAQALAYQAYDASGRRRVQLARQALAADPDCCEAHLILAHRINDPQHALPLLKRAVEAGERQIGEETFKVDVGHFWGIPETRPYMRARASLATTLMDLEKFDEAIDHFKDLLRLNPGDNQGNRYQLAHALLRANRLDELDELLNGAHYKGEVSPEWAYTRALLAYRRGGDSPLARAKLGDARRVNPHVARMLAGREQLPPFPPDAYSPGSVDEAVSLVFEMADVWEETDGAIEWLEAVTGPEDKRAKQWNRERERKQKRGRR
jgi:tetratricopeptide (TPR) repeat protein